MKRIDPRTCTSLNFSALQLSLGHDHLGEIRPCLKSRGRRRRCLFASQRSHPPFRNLYPPYKCLQVCVAAHDILHMGYLVPERLRCSRSFSKSVAANRSCRTLLYPKSLPSPQSVQVTMLSSVEWAGTVILLLPHLRHLRGVLMSDWIGSVTVAPPFPIGNRDPLYARRNRNSTRSGDHLFIRRKPISASPHERHPSKSIRTVSSSVPKRRTMLAFAALLGN